VVNNEGEWVTPEQFVSKWKRAQLKERSAAQEHFLDLCHVLEQPTPAQADPTGDWYCFERGAKKLGGGEGWADVWMRGHFGWEYKGKRADLDSALVQLQRYALALENPPLLVVSDLDRIEIHTNWTNTVHQAYQIPLEELPRPDNLQRLRWLFTDPQLLRPDVTTEQVTQEAAGQFAALAQRLRDRGNEPQRVAHFLNRLVFCLFAEDAGLLPSRVFHRALEAGQRHPAQSEAMLRQLFGAMARGGLFGPDIIEWFNGGLFDDDAAIPLTEEDIAAVVDVARLDWAAIEPSIFGTLFERGLDPSKRSQLGAHYTDAASIMRIVNPVIVEPLLAEWATVKAGIERSLAKAAVARSAGARTKAQNEAAQSYQGFMHRLAEYRVLDPACGSGNFLYLALQALKDIEHRAALEAEALGIPRGFTGMNVGVQCVQGIELNAYAAELARLTVWIGEIQWMLKHGVPPARNPILKPLHTIENRDAVLSSDGTEARWPPVDAIVGNPPFLGTKKQWDGLGVEYTERLRAAYRGRVPGFADLVCYWIEKARGALESGQASAAGLVATNSVRGGANREVLDQVVSTARIFCAWSDEEWINEGANVRVSIVCVAPKRSELPVVLNGVHVSAINADLTTGVDLTTAVRLPENADAAFYTTVKAGPFDIPGEVARQWLMTPNPHGAANADVVRPWSNGLDVLRRPSDTWIVDFGVDMPLTRAALYERPFEHVQKYVRPLRAGSKRKNYREYWWLLAEPIPRMRVALAGLSRYLVTVVLAKHRIFVWMHAAVLPDHALLAIAREDDLTFGLLQSRFHLLWALRLGTSLEDRPRYTPTTTFETFPFPDGMSPSHTRPADAPGVWLTSGALIPGHFPPATRATAEAIADAAKRLDDLRARWLNPPEWVERRPEVASGLPDRLVTRPEFQKEIAKRTLTNLYNARPAWLHHAHRELDAAVAAAYGWKDYTPELPDEEILQRLLALNLSRSA
jgi:type II restriction/modification system DNA methylase subunit YeeA